MRSLECLCLVAALTATGCGRARELGEKWFQGSGTSGKFNPFGEGKKIGAGEDDAVRLRGAIVSHSGSQNTMQGWILVLSGDDHAPVATAVVDEAGLYAFAPVAIPPGGLTLTLLTPDFIVTSVLAVRGTIDSTIYQYFRPLNEQLPILRAGGPTIRFQDLEGVELVRSLASDIDSDGVPDGTISFLQGPNPESYVDTDADGVVNQRDVDIDGDGIANWIDQDDNGNGILDVFDGDANGDLVNDTAPGAETTDPYFVSVASWIAVAVEGRVQDDGSIAANLGVTLKRRSDAPSTGVHILGAPSLLDGAVTESGEAWDRRLQDDGRHHDGSPNDDIYGARVGLAAGKLPKAHEALFFEFEHAGVGARSVPFVFPGLWLGELAAKFDPASRLVSTSGDPFGYEVQDYVWHIRLFDAAGTEVWESQPIPASTRTFPVPENVMNGTPKGLVDVVARTLEKVPGYPTFQLSSLPVTF